MFTHRFATFALASILAVHGAAISRAGDSDRGVVQVRGTADSVRPAETVRLQVELLAQGKDLQQALKALAERTKQATRQVQDWGATKASIYIASPAEATDRFAAPQLADLQPVAFDFDGGAPPPPAQPAADIRPIVSATLTADFPLPGKSDTGSLVFVERLRQRIANADLSGRKSLDAGVACVTCGPQPGAASLVFTRKVTDEEQAEALAAAFANARRSAERLAAAAGLTLGGVRAIAAADATGFGGPMPGALPGALPGARGFDNRPGSAAEIEAVGQTPGPITHQAAIEVTFEAAPASSGDSAASQVAR